MSFHKDFKTFLFRGNVIDLALAVVVGGAFGKIVTAFVEDLVMPVVGVLLPDGEWRNFTVTPVGSMQLKVGHLLGALVDFLIIAAVLFLVLVKLIGKLNEKAPPAAPTKTCGECLETVPVAAKRCRACTAVLTTIVMLLLAPAAFAQGNPKFDFTKPEEPKPSEWKAQAKGGLLLTGGNSQTTTGTLAALGSYKHDMDRVSLDGGLAYAKANILTIADTDGDGMIADSEITRTPTTTSNSFQAKGRYDRFFTLNNSGYVSAQVLRDRPAGKELIGGGQTGYSRQLFKDDHHLAVVELGYDFSYEKSVGPDAVGVPVHSGRVFAADTVTINQSTGGTLSFEMLTNLNKEKAPAPRYVGADALSDTRLVGKMGLTTTLWKNLSFGFGFTVRYDNAPAPLPPGKVPYAGTPLAKKTDVIAEGSLIVTLF